ncbi:DUF3152 domain-containing protein [Cellulomonas sp. ATA003]|uniref:DUF3152 domain-containing protein n=1 Tax=Cellulomonas sp. ATA003 TaxID=3073064 RepID=UPI0028733781|nr:DUF3152 domain-containing protein [Cellulomonas sp. ATA003]WNB86123.1 DUF3152 domain-containing protein [Cellulomonas sp. ATA003]
MTPRPSPAVSGWVAAGAITVAVAGGVGTAALVQIAGARTGPDAAADQAVSTVRATPVTVPEDLTGDVRPLPLPQLVDRDTVGPLWLTPADEAAGVLSLDVPESASGVLDVVAGSSPPVGTGPVRTVRVEVERGLPVDGAVFAATVMSTLTDPRGWGARGDVAFAQTDGPADIRVVLASPDLVDAMCAPLDTGGQVSCGRNGHAALNFRRWVHATPEFADRGQYRQYLVNHEVGHLLGHPHEGCPGEGQPAPLMQQQSLAVAPCEPNGWPYPQG